MKRILLLLTVIAIAISTIVAADPTFPVELKLDDVTEKFEVAVKAGALTAWEEGGTTIANAAFASDGAGGKQYEFTVLWKMVTKETAPTSNKVYIKVESLKNKAASSDVLAMTAETLAPITPDSYTYDSSVVKAENIALDSGKNIIAFATASKVETKGGIPVKLSVSEASINAATTGAAYQTNVTLSVNAI